MTKTTIKTETIQVEDSKIVVEYTRETTADYDLIEVKILSDWWVWAENSFGTNMKRAEKWAAKMAAKLEQEIRTAA